MRIISGKLKGRELSSFKADHIRPTTDRVKGSIFNKLSTFLEEARVLDLYSGTGNLGIEAYSRGARYVMCVESHKGSIQIIEKNLEKLKIQEAIDVEQCDVFDYIKNYQGEPYDLVLIDPPFTEKLAHPTMLAMQDSRLCIPESIVVIESAKQEPIESDYQGFKFWDRKDFGDKKVSFFIKI